MYGRTGLDNKASLYAFAYDMTIPENNIHLFVALGWKISKLQLVQFFTKHLPNLDK